MTIPEYKSECAVPAAKMRLLSDQSILILKVYKPYRYGWDDSVKKYRSFYYFPARLTADVVYSWDESAKIQEWDTFVLREKFWDNDVKKFAFRKIGLDKTFYKTYRKVMDIDIAPSKDATFNIWDGGMQKEVPVTMGLGNTFTLRGVPASRVIGMIEAHDLDANVELVDGKDKTGNPAKVRPYDFEDNLINDLAGKFIKFKVRGEGMDTRFTFKEGEEFDPTAMPEASWTPIDPEDLPF